MSAAHRVAIYHAVARATDEIGVEYDLISDGERIERLWNAARHVIDEAIIGDDLTDALIGLLAEGHAWLEALSVKAAR